MQALTYQVIANYLERPISMTSSGPEQVGLQGYRIINGGYRAATSDILSYDILFAILWSFPSGIANEHKHTCMSHQSKAFVKPWPVFQSVDGEFQPHSTSL